MKKLFFIAAIAGAALVSCTKNEFAPSATEQHEITFANPVTSVLTKSVDLATGSTYPASADAPFYVFADYHKDEYDKSEENDFVPYMRGNGGVAVTYTTDEFKVGENTFDQYWKPESPYFWPMDGHLTFAAYSTGKPNRLIGGTVNYTLANGVKVENYTIDNSTANTNNQYDLMLSKRAYNQTKANMVANNTVYDGVQIQFHHALSAIKFAVNTDKDYTGTNYTIKLNSLTIKNAYSTADLTQFAGKDKDLNLETIWSEWGDENDYTAYSNTEGRLVTYCTAEQVGATYVNSSDADIVLLPQALSHTSTSRDVIVEIEYTVHHPDMGAKSITYVKDFPLAGVSSNSENVAKWEAGKRYIYNIIFGMEEIVFAPVIVADWNDVKIDIEVPEDEIK